MKRLLKKVCVFVVPSTLDGEVEHRLLIEFETLFQSSPCLFVAAVATTINQEQYSSSYMYILVSSNANPLFKHIR